MDKNKSAYKLKNLPPIYYINLDEKPDRAKFMEDQFKYWEIENYENRNQNNHNKTSRSSTTLLFRFRWTLLQGVRK